MSLSNETAQPLHGRDSIWERAQQAAHPTVMHSPLTPNAHRRFLFRHPTPDARRPFPSAPDTEGAASSAPYTPFPTPFPSKPVPF